MEIRLQLLKLPIEFSAFLISVFQLCIHIQRFTSNQLRSLHVNYLRFRLSTLIFFFALLQTSVFAQQKEQGTSKNPTAIAGHKKTEMSKSIYHANNLTNSNDPNASFQLNQPSMKRIVKYKNEDNRTIREAMIKDAEEKLIIVKSQHSINDKETKQLEFEIDQFRKK